MMIDFTADWCAACKELEHKTHVDAAVQREAERFVNLKLDDRSGCDHGKLFSTYAVLGLPTVVFIDSTGPFSREPRSPDLSVPSVF
ncbi:MAG: thioredoxin family protein [Myxococcota bacterium]